MCLHWLDSRSLGYPAYGFRTSSQCECYFFVNITVIFFNQVLCLFESTPEMIQKQLIKYTRK
ncbi:hypothetical protein STEG23_012509, partial [Scotinomys teguina]